MKAEFELLATSDWHLRENAWKKHPELSGDAICSLTQIVDVAVERKVNGVLAGGDLYDTLNPTPDVQIDTHVQMDRAMEANVPFLYIEGQHERSLSRARLGVHKWPIHIHQMAYEFHKGPTVYGLDWRPAHELRPALDAILELDRIPDLLLCHQVWSDEAFMGGLPTTEGTLMDCPTPYVVTGDLHKHFQVKIRREDGTFLRVFSPGSTCMQAIDEPPQKSIWSLKFSGSKLLSWESIPLKVRPFHSVSLDTEEGLGDLIEDLSDMLVQDPDLPSEIRRPILEVSYPDDLPGAYDRLHDAVRNKAHLFLSARPTKAKVARPKSVHDRVRTRMGLLDFLSNVFSENSDEYRDARRLLEVADDKPSVLAELERMKNEWTNAKEDVDAD